MDGLHNNSTNMKLPFRRNKSAAPSDSCKEEPKVESIISPTTIAQQWFKLIENYKDMPRVHNVLKGAKLVYNEGDERAILGIPVRNEAQKCWIENKIEKELQDGLQRLCNSPQIIMVVYVENDDTAGAKNQQVKSAGQTSIVIGEKYPGNIMLGQDFILPQVTYDGLNILISLTQLDEDLENSILNNQFNAFFVNLLGVPMVAFQFDCGINMDWSLNILKVSEQYRQAWLSDRNTGIVIILVEAETGIVRGARTCDLPLLNDVRDACQSQLGSSMDEMESFINNMKSRMDTTNIIIGAQKYCTIPKATSL